MILALIDKKGYKEFIEIVWLKEDNERIHIEFADGKTLRFIINDYEHISLETNGESYNLKK